MSSVTLTTAVLISLVRSVLVALVALGSVAILERWIASSGSRTVRQIRTALAIAPFFVPELLIGFHYRLSATQWTAELGGVAGAIATELLYGVLQIGRASAVGLCVGMLLPRSSVTPESLYSWKLLQGHMDAARWWRGWIRLHLAGPWNSRIVCWSLMTLVAFQEFETAALMQIDRYPIAWTVWLFDAHAARQPLSDSLRMVVGPVLLEILILLPAVLLIGLRGTQGRGEQTATMMDSDRVSKSPALTRVATVLSGLFGTLFVVWPVVSFGADSLHGIWFLGSNPTLGWQAMRSILASGLFAAMASVAALNVCELLMAGSKSSRVLTWILLIPGLGGSLLLSLSLLAMFQWPVFRMLYDTWLPMVLGQTLSILPRAFAMVLLLRQWKNEEALHSAELLLSSPQRSIRLTGAALLWRMRTFRRVLAALVLAHWAFWDITVISNLKPIDPEPVASRLYNEMHFARTESLLGLAVLSLFVPVLLWGVALFGSRFSIRWFSSDRQAT
ncbi:MAG: hypothetical protein JNM43_18720 [Planctomycetaceae bacterium]|nr:hypothetical protein [Planctomycetaceae bacterium]